MGRTWVGVPGEEHSGLLMSSGSFQHPSAYHPGALQRDLSYERDFSLFFYCRAIQNEDYLELCNFLLMAGIRTQQELVPP